MIPAFLHPRGLTFVDIETTGATSSRDSITEIGIVEVDEDGVREWSSLVRPDNPIPDYIERLTGISNEMVADAPRFAELADAVFDRLHDRIFVAHNARFDHGFIRAAFRRLGVVLDEGLLPVAPAVLGACDMLGIDPVHVANEGVFTAIVAPEEAEAAVVALRETAGGGSAAVVGEIVANPGGIVAMRTPFGGTRIVDMLVGDPLPRIC